MGSAETTQTLKYLIAHPFTQDLLLWAWLLSIKETCLLLTIFRDVRLLQSEVYRKYLPRSNNTRGP